MMLRQKGEHLHGLKKLYNDLNGYYNTWNTASHGPNAKVKYPTTPKADINYWDADGTHQPYYIAGHYNPLLLRQI